MSVEKICEKVNRFDKFEKEFFVEIVQALKSRECDMIKESYKDLEMLNELNIQEILNAIEDIEALKKGGKYLTPNEKNEILNTTLLKTLDL